MRDAFYEVIQEINRTEEKEIYLVKHKISNTIYVKKVLPRQEDVSIYEQLCANPHSNMANIIEYENREHALIVIEEFINGTTLPYEMSARKLSLSEIKQIFEELFEVCHHLHSLQPPVIHRDIKPENIMLEKGHVKLIDFEIARNTQKEKDRDTKIIGSVGYAAPEQYGFRQSDQRSDIYAIGVLMKELMEGIEEGKQYQDIIEKCMELDPDQRYQTIKELQKDFHREKQTKKHSHKASTSKWNIPGFQQETTLQKIMIFCFYVFVLWAAFDIKMSNPTSLITIVCFKLSFFICLLSLLWVPKNVGNVLYILPYARSEKKSVRILNGMAVWMIVCFCTMFALVMISTIIESFL